MSFNTRLPSDHFYQAILSRMSLKVVLYCDIIGIIRFKILFKRNATPYEPVRPDPQFRRRVFRDDSRTSPDKLGKWNDWFYESC